MATQRNAMAPDLGAELKELRRRLDAAERRPDTLNKFDRYPTTEWAAIDRGKLAGNTWSSCGIADVTGLVYDRVEAKFITHRMIQGEREAEVRLAAFRHYGNAQKECVSASRSFLIHGASDTTVGACVFRWQHGIPFGWDYADGTATYTVELQHRYLKGPTPPTGNRTQVFGYFKAESDPVPTKGGGMPLDPDSEYRVPALGGDNMDKVTPGWVTIPSASTDDGTYAISNMHYCVGLPEDRIPEATTDGWAWYSGGTSEWGQAGNVSDPFVG